MAVEILMPALSPTMTEGNLTKWLKKEGEKVEPGDVIAEIETDKATMEVESIDEGILGKIFVNEGTENVKVNKVIAVLLQDGESVADIKPSQDKSTNFKSNEIKAETLQELPTEKEHSSTNKRLFASPLAKRIAKEKNIDISAVSGSGPHGRVIKADVENYKIIHANITTSEHIINRNAEDFRRIPHSNIRKVIAKRLVESKQNIPHFYLSIECNMDKLMLLRKEVNSTIDQDITTYKLSVNDFIIKATALSMRDVPEVNSSWSNEEVLIYNNVDISVAVAIDDGLITPIIRNADQKSLSSISNEMKSLIKKAKTNSLKPEEFQGGGFSISNLGMFNIKNFKAIINPPQTAILACGAAVKRPIVTNDNIIIANICDFSLSCDHRVVDGAIGAKFLQAFKKYIENPVLMLI